MEDNGVLVFRGLHLEPEAQVAFCRRLGEIDHSSDGHHPVPGIYPITLDKSKNASAAYLKATFDWHIDGCTPTQDEYPQKATVLSAVQVAERGGETEFANAYAAYDVAERRREGAVRLACGSCTRWRPRSGASPRTPPQNSWRGGDPAAPTSIRWCGRIAAAAKSLVLGASADYVVGMDLDAGRALLAELLERATVADKVYSHAWSVGDTVIWDNRGVLHRAAPTTPTQPREMLRTTVLGDEPIQ